MTLSRPPSPGLVSSLIERMRSDLSRLETECLGHYIAGPLSMDMKDMAARIARLTKPNKDFLPGPAKRFTDAA